MKKIYISPKIKLQFVKLEGLMETFSLPTTGNVDDPNVGNAREFTVDEEWNPWIKTESDQDK